MKINESGRSMLEMLSVLAIIGILSMAAFFGYQKTILKTKINKTLDVTVVSLQKYADFVFKNVKGMNISGENAMEDAMTIGLAETCQLFQSDADSTYQICEVPLGEMYLKFEDKGDGLYSYMLFIMMIDQKPEICTSFLAQSWDQVIPQEWHKNAKIWIKSDTSEETIVYPEGFQNVTPTTVASACNSACSTENEHCMIVFDIADIQGGM